MIYKIRNPKTGLFSRGGSHPTFNKKGKIWTNIGYVKSHLNFISGKAFFKFGYKDCEIVMLEMVEVDTISLSDIFKDVEENREKRDEDILISVLQGRLHRAQQEYDMALKDLEKQRSNK